MALLLLLRPFLVFPPFVWLREFLLRLGVVWVDTERRLTVASFDVITVLASLSRLRVAWDSFGWVWTAVSCISLRATYGRRRFVCLLVDGLDLTVVREATDVVLTLSMSIGLSLLLWVGGTTYFLPLLLMLLGYCIIEGMGGEEKDSCDFPFLLFGPPSLWSAGRDL